MALSGLDEYQFAAKRFALRGSKARWALKLAAEAGEVAQEVERTVYGDKPYDPEVLKLELGDCLWYLSQLAEICGMSLSEVAESNIAKLERRHGPKPETDYERAVRAMGKVAADNRESFKEKP